MVLVQIEDVDLRLIHICTGPEQELQLGEVWVIFWVEAWKTPTWSWDPRTSTDRHQSGWCDLCCPQTPGWQRKELKNTSTWSWVGLFVWRKKRICILDSTNWLIEKVIRYFMLCISPDIKSDIVNIHASGYWSKAKTKSSSKERKFRVYLISNLWYHSSSKKGRPASNV